jgi:hypothetical protein
VPSRCHASVNGDQAFAVDGVDDYVSVADSAPLSLTTTGTVAAWVTTPSWLSTAIQTAVAKPRISGGTGYAQPQKVSGDVRQGKPGKGGSDVDSRRQSGNLSDVTR